MYARVKRHFQQVDPILFSVVEKIPPFTITPNTDYFVSLCEAIISQQLSEKAGATIWGRFQGLFGSDPITPKNALALSNEQMRAVGTSWSKVSYIKNLAQKVHDGEVHLDNFSDMRDEEVIAELTRVKGIGPWTAEMFLMFTLGREDVFSYGDLGLKNAILKLYKLKKPPARRTLERIVNRWSPYRTWAARILWKSLEL